MCQSVFFDIFVDLGVLLVIDEADAFLCSRKKAGMSEALRNGLTTMLYHTGTQLAPIRAAGRGTNRSPSCAARNRGLS